MVARNSREIGRGLGVAWVNIQVLRAWLKEHKPQRSERNAYVTLALLSIVLSFGNYLISLHEIAVNNQKFCDLLATAVPVQKPADPIANQSREKAYEGYVKVSRLSHSLGCK